MRKIGAISLSLLYLALSVGLTVNVHFCGGKIGTIKFVETNGTCCCAEKKEDCCKDQVFFLQLDDDQQTPQSNRVALYLSPTVLPVFLYDIYSSELSEEAKVVKTERGPPLIKDIYLLHCSLTHYG